MRKKGFGWNLGLAGGGRKKHKKRGQAIEAPALSGESLRTGLGCAGLESIDSACRGSGAGGDLFADGRNLGGEALMPDFEFLGIHGEDSVEEGHLGRVGGHVESFVGIFDLVGQINDKLGKAPQFAEMFVDIANGDGLGTCFWRGRACGFWVGGLAVHQELPPDQFKVSILEFKSS